MKKLYIKDLTTGEHRAYGSNHHDSLVSLDGGKTLQYYNLQNGDGSKFGEYRFCDESGNELNLDEHGGEYANIGGFSDDKEDENPWHDLIQNPDDLPSIVYNKNIIVYMLNTEMLITCKTKSREPWVRKAKLLYEDGTSTLWQEKKLAWFDSEYPFFGDRIDKMFDEDIVVTAWKYTNFFTEEPYKGGE